MGTLSLCFLSCLLSLPCVVSGDKVLLVSHQMNSHLMQLHMVGEGLARQGHQVFSVIQHGLIEPDKLPMTGIKPIYYYTTDENNSRVRNMDKLIGEAIFHGSIDAKRVLDIVVNESCNSCDIYLHDADLMNTLKQSQFDLALVDRFLLAYCNFLVPHLLGIPYVSLSAGTGLFVGGTPNLPSFVPCDIMSYSDNMTLKQRLINFLFVFASTSKLFPGNGIITLLEEFAPEITSWNALVEKSILHFTCEDHILDWPMPSMPNVIRTPGITIRPAKPLSPSFESIVADKQVILVTFGSSFSNIPLWITEKFVAAFSQVNYTIIWRLSAESSSQVTMPDNVHVVSWLPQNDLLGDPATKLFITHCGNNGQYEAVYQAVPMIGFPLFADQPRNCFRMEHHMLGKCMDIRTFEPDVLADNINEIAGEGSIYQRNVDKRSSILLDTDARPVNTMVRWIEHVMTHGGEHLHSHAADMTWYQYWMLDVLSLILTLIFVILAAIIWTVRRLCCSKKQKEKQQ